MEELLDSHIEISCPGCGRDVRTTLRAVKKGNTVSCPLGHRIELREEGHGIADADRAIKDFKRSIDDLNRKLK